MSLNQLSAFSSIQPANTHWTLQGITFLKYVPSDMLGTYNIFFPTQFVRVIHALNRQIAPGVACVYVAHVTTHEAVNRAMRVLEWLAGPRVSTLLHMDIFTPMGIEAYLLGQCAAWQECQQLEGWGPLQVGLRRGLGCFRVWFCEHDFDPFILG